MRFMIIRNSDRHMEAGELPTKDLMTAIGSYYDEMRRAGVLLAGDWLQPSSKGARIVASGRGKTVVDGPFAEIKELIAGFILIDVPSMEEAIAWAQRCPTLAGDCETRMEIRQVYEVSDFPPELAGELARRG
ncbi:MAG TPA: YciI family protein [Edaphobacter sp.]|nr:YciI family protein [Edaphobacter sp.]